MQRMPVPNQPMPNVSTNQQSAIMYRQQHTPTDTQGYFLLTYQYSDVLCLINF